jgi:dCMP deaminase
MTTQKQLKYDKAYLRMASEWGKLSYCKRKQVGAIIVKDRMIISDGYNGTPTGFENLKMKKGIQNGMYCMQKQTPY